MEKTCQGHLECLPFHLSLYDVNTTQVNTEQSTFTISLNIACFLYFQYVDGSGVPLKILLLPSTDLFVPSHLFTCCQKTFRNHLSVSQRLMVSLVIADLFVFRVQFPSRSGLTTHFRGVCESTVSERSIPLCIQLRPGLLFYLLGSSFHSGQSQRQSIKIETKILKLIKLYFTYSKAYPD